MDAAKAKHAEEVFRDLLTRGAFLAARAGIKAFEPGERVVATLMDEIPGHPEFTEVIAGVVIAGPLAFMDGFSYLVKLDKKPSPGPVAINVMHAKLRKEG
jgi:hypothetical protein